MRKIVVITVPLLVIAATIALFAYYQKKGVPPIQVANAVITCSQTVCGAKGMSPVCAQLSAAVTGCLGSGVNPSVCLAGVLSLVSVGYADVVCVVSALALASPKAVTRYPAPPTDKSFKYEDKSWEIVPGEPGEASGEVLDETSDIQHQASEWLKTQKVIVNP